MKLTLITAAAALSTALRLLAVDHHVTTAQEFQNALTIAASNGTDDTIFLAAGLYQGNFNFQSAEAFALTIQNEAGVGADQIVLDGAGVGGTLNLNCADIANLWLGGITIQRNTGDGNSYALSVATSGNVQIEHCILPCAADKRGGGISVSKANNITISHSSLTTIGTVDGSTHGRGVNLAGFSGGVLVDSCVVTGNLIWNTGSGAGLRVTAGSGDLKSVSIRNSTISNNQQGWGNGGGISFEGNCTTTVTGNTFQGNVARVDFGGGAAIYSEWDVTNNVLTGNRFLGNGCESYGNGGGGAVRLRSGTVEGNEFDGNRGWRSTFSGGALYMSGGTIRNNVFRNNSASQGGAACLVGNFVISNNTFLRNSAGGSAGGLNLVTSDPTGSIATNNLFAQNSSGDSGGGMAATLNGNAARLDLVNNTFTGNTSTNLGGGLRIGVVANDEILNVYNNIIWGNSAHQGDDIYLSGFGSSKKLMNNAVHDVAGVFELALNNIDAAPVFFNPNSDDYHVRLGSLTIDAGDPAAPNLPSTDRDGRPRVAGLRVDMGCYEFDNTGTHPADLNDDFVISQAEYDNYAAAWKNDLAWPRGPQPIDADYVTRAGYILNNGGTYHNAGGSIPTNWKPGTGN